MRYTSKVNVSAVNTCETDWNWKIVVIIKVSMDTSNMSDILDGPAKTCFVPEKYKNRDPYKKLVNHGKTPPPNIDG